MARSLRKSTYQQTSEAFFGYTATVTLPIPTPEGSNTTWRMGGAQSS